VCRLRSTRVTSNTIVAKTTTATARTNATMRHLASPSRVRQLIERSHPTWGDFATAGWTRVTNALRLLMGCGSVPVARSR
jgi:hypothetical protein